GSTVLALSHSPAPLEIYPLSLHDALPIFICGLIPLTIASGAGAIGNRTIGTAAAGGMLVGTLVGVFLIPGLYVVFATIDRKFKEKKTQPMPAPSLNQQVTV